MAVGYSVVCPYGDGEMQMEEGDGEDGTMPVGYIWHSVEFFLTVKGAEEYIEANKHNHGKLRIYVHHIGEGNFEMRDLLETLKLREVL